MYLIPSASLPNLLFWFPGITSPLHLGHPPTEPNRLMSLAGIGQDAWGSSQPELSPQDTVAAAIEKERIIKDILSLRDGLRGLMVRVTEVESENDRLKKDNEMLAVYIDNL